MTKMDATGERQVGVVLKDIRQDHRARYEWATGFADAGAVVLDAGCGVGYGSCLLTAAKASVWALDRDAATIDYAREHWQNDAVSYHVANITSHEFPAGVRFDLVVAFELIEHLVAPDLFLRNLRRVTHPESRLLVSVPNQSFASHTVELNPYHIRHYSQSDLQELVAACGFRVERVYCQDEKEIVEGTAGRTLLALCRPDPETSVTYPDLPDLQRALDDAEGEINARANAIRRLQALNGRWSEDRPANLGTLQLSIREHAAQVAAQISGQELARVREASDRDRQELTELRRTHGETVAMLNRANIALEICGTQLEKAQNREAQQTSRIRQLEKEFKSRASALEHELEKQSGLSEDLRKESEKRGRDLKTIRQRLRADKEFFDPAAPTLAGLARLMWRHRFFLTILPKATLNSVRNVYSVFVKPRIGTEAVRK